MTRAKHSNYAMRCVYERQLAMSYARATGSMIERCMFVRQAKKINRRLVRDLRLRRMLRDNGVNILTRAVAFLAVLFFFGLDR